MAMPPVCKILDWGRFKYEQSKKESEARKHQKVTQLKEIRMRPRTDDHDVSVKVRKIQEFLAEGDKVKVSVTFRGREMAHPELGRALLEEIIQELKGTATIERPAIMEGRMVSMIVSRGTGTEGAKRTADGQAARPPRPAAAGAPAPEEPDANETPAAPPVSAQDSERAPAPTAQ